MELNKTTYMYMYISTITFSNALAASNLYNYQNTGKPRRDMDALKNWRGSKWIAVG